MRLIISSLIISALITACTSEVVFNDPTVTADPTQINLEASEIQVDNSAPTPDLPTATNIIPTPINTNEITATVVVSSMATVTSIQDTPVPVAISEPTSIIPTIEVSIPTNEPTPMPTDTPTDTPTATPLDAFDGRINITSQTDVMVHEVKWSLINNSGQDVILVNTGIYNDSGHIVGKVIFSESRLATGHDSLATTTIMNATEEQVMTYQFVWTFRIDSGETMVCTFSVTNPKSCSYSSTATPTSYTPTPILPTSTPAPPPPSVTPTPEYIYPTPEPDIPSTQVAPPTVTPSPPTPTPIILPPY